MIKKMNTKFIEKMSWNRYFSRNPRKPHKLFRKHERVFKPLGRDFYRIIHIDSYWDWDTSTVPEDYVSRVDKQARQIGIKLLGKATYCKMLWGEGELEIIDNDGGYHYAKIGGEVYYSNNSVEAGQINPRDFNGYLKYFGKKRAIVISPMTYKDSRY